MASGALLARAVLAGLADLAGEGRGFFGAVLASFLLFAGFGGGLFFLLRLAIGLLLFALFALELAGGDFVFAAGIAGGELSGP